MLTRIYCEKFGETVPGKTIRFERGLNIVLGADGNTNSIGKSTALLIIDFCFGGNTYPKQDDVIANVGHHIIYFTFRFDGQDYHFARGTEKPDSYWECDADFNRLGDPKPIKELTDFLKTQYLPNTLRSFRTIASRFMRINGKSNYDVIKPLRAHANKPDDSEAISSLEDLFGELAGLEDKKRKLEEAKKSISSFKSAQSGSWIRVQLTKKSDYKSALKTIAELEPQVAQIKARIEAGDNQDDPEISPEIVQIRADLSFETRRKSRLQAKIKKLSSFLEGESMTESDLKTLQALFPGVDLRPLQEIATFRAQLAANVNAEIESEKTAIQDELRQAEERIAAIKKRLEALGIDPNASKSLLERYNAMSDELRRLKKQVEFYEKNAASMETRKALNQELKGLEPSILQGISESINAELESINDRLYTVKRMAPILTFPTLSKYEYRTPNDTGTGTTYKSLIILDLALLKLSALPVLIHDSLLFSDIWKEPVSNLFAEYAQIEKQSFLAIDGIETFNEATKATILQASRLSLGGGEDSLFGFSWAVKKKVEDAQSSD